MKLYGELIRDMVDQANGDDGPVHFRAGYSGRGMYGMRCVGIVGSMRACMRVIAEVIKWELDSVPDSSDPGRYAAQREVERLVDTLLAFDTDSMGRSDVILYWPTIAAVAETADAAEGGA